MKKPITSRALVITSLFIILGLIAAGIGCASTTSPTSTPSQTTATTPSATTPLTTAKPITLKVTGYGGTTYPLRIYLEEAMKMVKERSGGRIAFDYYPEESLVKMKDLYDAMPAGVVDIGLTCALYRTDITGLIGEVANMPFNFNGELFMEHYRDPGNFYDFQQPYWQKLGMYLLSWGYVGDTEVAGKTPLHKVEDFKGKLIRAAGGGCADGIKLLGAQPVSITPGEVYEALQRGTVDGGTASISQMRTMKWSEVIPYYTIWGYTTASIQFLMRAETRKTLPSDLVKIIDESFLEAERLHHKRLTGLIADDTAYIQKQPNVKEVYIMPDVEKAAIAKAIAPVYDKFVEQFGAEWDRFWSIRNTLWK